MHHSIKDTMTSNMIPSRNVFIGNLQHDNDDHVDTREIQWAIKIGDTWTECDTSQPGQRVTINGGVRGGWFGWGSRTDGPLVTSSSAKSGVTLPREHVSLGHTQVTDEEILEFNREFVSEHSTYSDGLSEKYVYQLLGLLLGSGYLLQNYFLPNIDASESELSHQGNESEPELSDLRYESDESESEEDDEWHDSRVSSRNVSDNDSKSGSGSVKPGSSEFWTSESENSEEEQDDQSEKIDDEETSIKKRKVDDDNNEDGEILENVKRFKQNDTKTGEENSEILIQGLIHSAIDNLDSYPTLDRYGSICDIDAIV